MYCNIIYRTLKTDHVLQTIWRDLTSDVDIVGPYYTSNGPLEAKFTQVSSKYIIDAEYSQIAIVDTLK